MRYLSCLVLCLLPNGGHAARQISKIIYTDTSTIDPCPRIVFCNMDGSGAQTLVRILPTLVALNASAGQDRYAPNGVVVDRNANDVYWADSVVGKILRVNINEEDRKIHTAVDNLKAPDYLTFHRTTAGVKRLYWSDYNLNVIQRCELVDGDCTKIITVISNVRLTGGITLDPLNGYLYWADAMQLNIKRASWDDGSNVEIIQPFVKMPVAIAMHRDLNQYIYWIDQSGPSISRSWANGSTPEVLVNMYLSRPRGIAIEPKRQKLYWTDAGTRQLMSSNLKGESIQQLLGESDLVYEPRGLTLKVELYVGSDTYGESDPGVRLVPQAMHLLVAVALPLLRW